MPLFICLFALTLFNKVPLHLVFIKGLFSNSIAITSNLYFTANIIVLFLKLGIQYVIHWKILRWLLSIRLWKQTISTLLLTTYIYDLSQVSNLPFLPHFPIGLWWELNVPIYVKDSEQCLALKHTINVIYFNYTIIIFMKKGSRFRQLITNHSIENYQRAETFRKVWLNILLSSLSIYAVSTLFTSPIFSNSESLLVLLLTHHIER